ncbi:MAG: UPF0104 family protein [Chloroflexi bacterium]|nr:MAG: UPF0104 family protein [Chloroflexota bacterium]MBL1196573.1 UPF0104 family protein [Chloroflexota bacterium]NOH13868.1 flippase-like domain-containing protein [Chloroflexota bacterium]
MTTEQTTTPATAAGDWKRIVPGILISIIAIGALLYFADLEKVIEAVRNVDYRLIIVAGILFIVTVAARAVAWRTILQEQVSYSRIFWTLNEGYLLNNILPFRLGELGRAFLLSRTSDLRFWQVLSSIVVERVFDVAMMATLLLTTLPFVIGADWAWNAAVVAAALVVVGFVTLYLAARYPQTVLSIFDRVLGGVERLHSFGRPKAEAFLEGLGALTDLRRFLKVLFWMALMWFINVTWYFVLLRAFLPDSIFLWAAFLVGVSALGVAVPSSPAYVGVLEAAIVGALALFGVDGSVAFAYAVVAHTIYFVITVSLGTFALVRDGASLGQLYADIRNRAAQD